ncbi:hypothetical protein O6H91_Y455500 [Diphasiastrum complanatum]|nr:hypothetical protein O6H91_Y455500 [Diphasiastrum complanatum]
MGWHSFTIFSASSQKNGPRIVCSMSLPTSVDDDFKLCHSSWTTNRLRATFTSQEICKHNVDVGKVCFSRLQKLTFAHFSKNTWHPLMTCDKSHYFSCLLPNRSYPI